MKGLSNIKSLFGRRSTFALAVFGCLIFGSLQMAKAQSTTFADFTQTGAAVRPFVFTNNSPTASGTFNTATGGAPVRFYYNNFAITGLNAALVGQQDATLTMTSSTTIPATNNGSGDLTQPIETITIAIIRDIAAPMGVGSGTRRNLLTITVTTGAPTLGGTVNGGSATLSASTPGENVVFTSDFLNFSATTARNFGISLSGGAPALTLGANNFLSTTGFNGVGTFASNPVPTVSNGTTAASVTVSGRVLNLKGRGLNNAQVIVTQADGSTRTVLTDNFGYYSFEGLVIPQTVIISVISKTYQFNPQIITLDSDFSELNFAPNN